MKKKILYGVVAIFIIIQFFRIDKTNPAINLADDFIEIAKPSEEIAVLLKSACYDCHSNQSEYPWYSNIAPVSWWVKDHINEGRDELNFSKWSTYSVKKKDHKLEEMAEELEEGEMPLKPYPLTHPEARLSDSQKEELINWIKALRKQTKEKKTKPTLHLNNGEKWQADEATNLAIAKMIELANLPLKGDFTSYQNIGKDLSKEMKALFGVCTMKGDAHDQLHVFLVPLVAKFRNLENVKTEEDAIVQRENILNHLNKYATYFK
jgi:hypothetical protein